MIIVLALLCIVFGGMWIIGTLLYWITEPETTLVSVVKFQLEIIRGLLKRIK